MTWSVKWSQNAVRRLGIIRDNIRIYSTDARQGTETARQVRNRAVEICQNTPEYHKDISENYYHLLRASGQSAHKIVIPPYVLHVHLNPATNTATILGIWHEKEDRPED